MDEDQCARRNAQKYLRIVDPDYYEFEGQYCALTARLSANRLQRRASVTKNRSDVDICCLRNSFS